MNTYVNPEYLKNINDQLWKTEAAVISDTFGLMLECRRCGTTKWREELGRHEEWHRTRDEAGIVDKHRPGARRKVKPVDEEQPPAPRPVPAPRPATNGEESAKDDTEPDKPTAVQAVDDIEALVKEKGRKAVAAQFGISMARLDKIRRGEATL